MIKTTYENLIIVNVIDSISSIYKSIYNIKRINAHPILLWILTYFDTDFKPYNNSRNI